MAGGADLGPVTSWRSVYREYSVYFQAFLCISPGIPLFPIRLPSATIHSVFYSVSIIMDEFSPISPSQATYLRGNHVALHVQSSVEINIPSQVNPSLSCFEHRYDVSSSASSSFLLYGV